MDKTQLLLALLNMREVLASYSAHNSGMTHFFWLGKRDAAVKAADAVILAAKTEPALTDSATRRVTALQDAYKLLGEQHTGGSGLDHFFWLTKRDDILKNIDFALAYTH